MGEFLSSQLQLNSFPRKMTQHLEQIKYFDENLKVELSKPQPNQEQVNFYRSQIDKLTSPSILQQPAGKFSFKNIFDISNPIICIFTSYVIFSAVLIVWKPLSCDDFVIR
jgi:hypothetical protein